MKNFAEFSTFYKDSIKRSWLLKSIIATLPLRLYEISARICKILCQKSKASLHLKDPYCTIVIEKKRCENICVYSYQQYRKEELRQFKNFIEFLKSTDLALFMPGPGIKNSTKNLQLIFKLKKLKLQLKKHLLQMPMFVYLCMKIELISNIMIC